MKTNFNSDLNGKSLADYHVADDRSIRLGDEIKPLVAEYSREGVDLMLTADNGDYITIHDYFTSFPGVDIVTSGGARIPSDVVSKLAGPGPLAQSSNVQNDAGGPIGEVTKLEGTVVAKHTDGTAEELVEGGSVYQGDVLETGEGSSFTLVFADNTQFTMGENGRAVLDEMIYNPSTGSGNFGISLLQGVFSLVSGQIAKDNHDNVDVRTPVGTIGIRGTSWSGNIKAIGEDSIFTLFTGAIVVTNEAGSQALTLPNQTVIVTSFSSLPSVPFIMTGEQLFNVYGEALRLINPNWFDDEDNFDPDKISPEAGGRRAYHDGGANFQAYSEQGIDGGASISDLLKSADLLGGTDLKLYNPVTGEEIVGVGPQTSLNVNAVVDPTSGAVNGFEIVITLNEPVNLPVTITYEIRSGSATSTDTGLPGDVDFVGLGDGTIIIPPGQTTAKFSITVVEDAVIENVEFFIVQLTGAENADINVTSSQALVVITDDDIGVISIGDVTVAGVDLGASGVTVGEGAGVIAYQLVLDKAVAPGVTVSVDYVITGSATAGSDYTTDAVQTVTFFGGTTGLVPGATATINIPIIDDNLFEGPESLTLTIVGGSSNAVADADANSFTVTIENNDLPVVIAEPPQADLDEASNGDTVEGGSLGIGSGSGSIAAVNFDAVQTDFDTANLTSGGVPIVLSGQGTNVLVGTADTQTIFTVTLNTDGTYDVVLDGPIDHIDTLGNNLSTLAFDLAFSVLDINGSSASGSFTVDVNDSVPVLGAASSLIVDEDDLPGGSDITPESTTDTGTALINFGLDGPGTVALDISGLPDVTSRGDPVEYDLMTLGDGVTQRVTAVAMPDSGIPRTVFTLDFGPNGVGDNYGYTMTLSDVIDHTGVGEVGRDFSFGYDVIDQDGSMVSGLFTATIVDDVPIASPDDVVLPAPQLPAYDLVFVLDTSGSMGQSVAGGSGTKMAVLKQAVANVLDEYELASRAVNITIIAFASASSVVFEGSSISDAQAFINDPGNLVPSGATNYAAALADTATGAQGVLSADLADPAFSDYNMTVYFISDGAPSSGSGVPTGGGNVWQEFVDSNGIEVVAVGLGSGTSTPELAKVENAGDDPTIVINPNDLGTVLVDSIPVVEVDNVVSSGSVDQIGADDGTVTSLSYNGASYDIPQNGDSLVLDTALGGSISIDAAGNYTYTAPQSVEPGSVESFEYFLTDGDGDISSAILSFTFVENIAGGLIAFAAFAPQLNLIEGTDGSEVLFGTDASEIISGLGGADTLQGNGGNDILIGGDGADVFAFTGADTGDVTITDFIVALDSIDLDKIFDDLGILVADRGQGNAWQLSEIDGKAALTFVAADTPTIHFENYINPDVQALDDIAAKIVVDQS
ncbi:MAG: VWA domain-containing protein [Sneathiella sp.]|nr:VWA domain-containing protein [Sneathiella sp.]